jgi:hypothetical protein
MKELDDTMATRASKATIHASGAMARSSSIRSVYIDV